MSIDPLKQFRDLTPSFTVDELKHDATHVEVQITKEGKVYKIESKDVRIINYLQGGDKAAAESWLKEVHGLIQAIHQDPSTKVTEVSWDPQSKTLSVKTKEGRWAKYEFDKSTPLEYVYSDHTHYQQKRSPLETKKTDLENQLTTLKAQKKGGIHFIHDRHIDSQCEALSHEVNHIENELHQLDFFHTTASVTRIALQALPVNLPAVDLKSENIAFHLIDRPLDVLQNLDVSNLKPEDFNKVFFGDIRVSFDSIKAVNWNPFFAANRNLSCFPIGGFISSSSLQVNQDELNERLYYLLDVAVANGCDLSTIPWSYLSEKELLMVLPEYLKRSSGTVINQILSAVSPKTRIRLLNQLSETVKLPPGTNKADAASEGIILTAANDPLADAQDNFRVDYNDSRFRIEERWKKTVQHVETTKADPTGIDAAMAEVEAKGSTEAEKAAIINNTTQIPGQGLFGTTLAQFHAENTQHPPVALNKRSELTEQKIVRGNPTQIQVSYSADFDMQLDGVSIQSDTPLFKFQGKYTLTWNEATNAFVISNYEAKLERVPIPIGFF